MFFGLYEIYLLKLKLGGCWWPFDRGNGEERVENHLVNHKLPSNGSHGDDEYEESGNDTITNAPLDIARVSHKLIQALATWLETLMFTYSGSLGKWPIGDLVFGIIFFRRQGNLHIASVFGGKDYLLLKGDIAAGLIYLLAAGLTYLLNLLTLCCIF